MKKLGGTDLKRLFLEDSPWADKTDIPGVDMLTLIARHKGRYALCGLFLRPGMKFLDFPCGSGYARELLAPFGAIYHGMDVDSLTIAHADYNNSYGNFREGDLTYPQLEPNFYDVIACIEGIEHIEQKYQAPLIKAFYDALKPGGVLIVSCPQAAGKSGPNPDNPYHLCELSDPDFCELLFDFSTFQVLFHREVLSTGKEQTMMFGIARK